MTSNKPPKPSKKKSTSSKKIIINSENNSNNSKQKTINSFKKIYNSKPKYNNSKNPSPHPTSTSPLSTSLSPKPKKSHPSKQKTLFTNKKPAVNHKSQQNKTLLLSWSSSLIQSTWLSMEFWGNLQNKMTSMSIPLKEPKFLASTKNFWWISKTLKKNLCKTKKKSEILKKWTKSCSMKINNWKRSLSCETKSKPQGIRLLQVWKVSSMRSCLELPFSGAN